MRRKKRRRGPGVCVYCLRTVDQLTEEHVLARSWYPDTTPPNMPKPKVPGCFGCNNGFSSVEKDLLMRMALSSGLEDLRTAGIPERALRGIDPTAAIDDEVERLHRERLRSKLYREIALASVGPASAGSRVIPGFDEHQPGTDLLRVPVKGEALHRFAEKLVRGITYWETQRLIMPEYRIASGLSDGPGPDRVISRFAGTTTSYGPGFVINASRKVDDPAVAILRLRVWNKLSIFATVTRPGSGPPWDDFVNWIDDGPTLKHGND